MMLYSWYELLFQSPDEKKKKDKDKEKEKEEKV